MESHGWGPPSKGGLDPQIHQMAEGQHHLRRRLRAKRTGQLASALSQAAPDTRLH